MMRNPKQRLLRDEAILVFTKSLARSLAGNSIRMTAWRPPGWTPLIPPTLKKQDQGTFRRKSRRRMSFSCRAMRVLQRRDSRAGGFRNDAL